MRVERAERGHLGPGEKEGATRPRWLLSWVRTGRGEREPGCASAGLGPRKRERGPRLNSGCWADLLGLGPVGFLFFSSPFLFLTTLKLFEFKFEFEFKPSTQTNKTIHQHECTNKLALK